MKLTLDLDGVTPASPQVWGSVRLIPLLRHEPFTDIRLSHRALPEHDMSIVERGDGSAYVGYLPHCLVVDWTDDGFPVVSESTTLGSRDVKRAGRCLRLQRMVKRRDRRSIRMLPMDVSLEAFLGQAFGGPEIRDRWLTRTFERHGFQTRSMSVVFGQSISGLREAVSLFERHENQCGMLIFVDDHLAAATLVGHPDDYKSLHESLITTAYGTLFERSGWHQREVTSDSVTLQGSSFEAIRNSLQAARDQQAQWARALTDGIFGQTVTAEVLRKVGRFRLVRFQTGHRAEQAMLGGEHLGEALVDDRGHLVYLKTYRLDRRQIRQAHQLSLLAAADWDPQRMADEQGHGDVARVRRDLENCGLFGLISAHPRYAERNPHRTGR